MSPRPFVPTLVWFAIIALTALATQACWFSRDLDGCSTDSDCPQGTFCGTNAGIRVCLIDGDAGADLDVGGDDESDAGGQDLADDEDLAGDDRAGDLVDDTTDSGDATDGGIDIVEDVTADSDVAIDVSDETAADADADATTEDVDVTSDADAADVADDLPTDPDVTTDPDVAADPDLAADPDSMMDTDVGCNIDDDCSNAQFCDGVERCVEGECLPGTPPSPADEWSCTIDDCDEETDSSAHTPNDDACSAAEICVESLCIPGSENTGDASGCFEFPARNGFSCGEGEICVDDECVEDGCGNNWVELALGEQCDDGNIGDDDGCDSGCQWEFEVNTGFVLSTDLTGATEDGADEWGSGFACLDVQANLVPDLVVWTDRGEGSGNSLPRGVPELRVFFGPIEADLEIQTDSDWVLYGVESGAVEVAVAELNGDLRDDIVVSLPELDDGEISDAGAVLVFFGSDAPSLSASLTVEDADKAFVGRFAGARLRLAGLHDLNGDETPDLIFQARHTSPGFLFRRTGLPAGDSELVPAPVENAVITGDTIDGSDFFGEWVQFFDRVDGTGMFVFDGADTLEDARGFFVSRLTWPTEPTPVNLLADVEVEGFEAAARDRRGRPLGLVDLNADFAEELVTATGLIVDWSATSETSIDLGGSSFPVVVDISFGGGRLPTDYFVASFIGDDRQDLLVISFPLAMCGGGVENNCGLLHAFPNPFNLTETLSLSDAPRGQGFGAMETSPAPRAFLRCDLQGDSEQEYLLGLPRIDSDAGLIRILPSFP